jgi:hypothetical protein
MGRGRVSGFQRLVFLTSIDGSVHHQHGGREKLMASVFDDVAAWWLLNGNCVLMIWLNVRAEKSVVGFCFIRV